MNTRPNPYVGPRSFQPGEPFYGRDRELRSLSALLIAERIVLLHSPSGAGKSSLVQAGLLPRLMDEEFNVLPTIRLNQEPPTEIASLPGINRYALSAMISMDEGIPESGRLPLKELATLTLDDYLTRRFRAENAPVSDVLVFDQFEEVLTIAPADRESKLVFFEQLGLALRNKQRWALFAIREDYLGALAPYTRPVPGRFAATFRLDLLGVDGALQAIQKPPQNQGVEFSTSAAQKLVDDLRRIQVQLPDGSLEEQLGQYVEPVQLQVVCLRLWQGLDDSASTIDETDLAGVGDVNQSLADYYSASVKNVAEKSDVGERSIREWFDRKLITPEGIRGQVLMGAESSEGLANSVVSLVEDAHIIRGEKRAGKTWYELSHDRMLKPVRENNTAWFEQNLSLFQRQAVLWSQQGRSDGLLLRGKEFQQAEKEIQGQQLTGDEKHFLEACRKLREREQRDRRRNTLMTVLAIGATIAMLVAGVFFFQAQASAIEAQKTSEQNAQLAQDNANVAATAKAAEQQAVEAKAETEATLKITEIELRKARNQQLSAQAELIQNEKPSLAALLALEAIKINQDAGESVSTVSYQALRDSLNQLGGTNFYDTRRDASALAFSPDTQPGTSGRWFLVGYQNGDLAFWDMNDKNVAPQVEKKHNLPITRILFAPNGLMLTASGGEVGLWQVSDKELPIYLETFQTGLSSIIDLALAPTETWFSASDRQNVVLVSVKDGKTGNSLTINNAKLGAFSPDGRWFAVAGFNPASEFTLQDQAALDQGLSKINFVNFYDLSASDPFSNVKIIDPGANYVNLNSIAKNSQERLGFLDNALSPQDEEAIAADAQQRVPYLGVISSLTFSPDNRKLIATSTSYTSQVLVWEISAQGLDNLTPTFYQINQCNALSDTDAIKTSISSDSEWFAVGCKDSSVQLYKLSQTGVSVQKSTLRIPGERCFPSGACRPNYRLDTTWLGIGKGSYNPISDIVNYEQAPDPVMSGSHNGPVVNLAFTPNNKILVTLSGTVRDAQGRTFSGDNTLNVWDVNSHASLYSVPVGASSGLLAVQPGSGLVVSAYENNSLRFWDDQQKNYTVDPLTIERFNFQLSADGQWFAFRNECDTATSFIDLTASNPMMEQFSLSDGEPSKAFTQNCGAFAGRNSIRFSVDGKFVSANSGQVWDISQKPDETIKPLSGSPQITDTFYLNVSELSPNGQWLLTGNTGVEVYALQIGETQKQKIALPDVNNELDGAQKIERRYAFSYDGKWLARYREQDSKVALLDLSSQGVERFKLSVRSGAVEYQSFSPDNRWLLAHTDAGALLLWDLSASDPNTTLLTFEGFPGLIETHFSKSGRWLVVYPQPNAAAPIQAGVISVFDMSQMSASAKPIQLTLEDTGYVNLSLSDDEKWLALVGRTGEAQLWDLSQQDFATNPLVIPDYGNQITAAVVSQDGSMLAVGTNAGNALLWSIEDLLAGNSPLILSGGSKALTHMEFSPDGRWMIGSGPEQRILLWHIRFDEALKLACEVVGRNLTPDEWSQNGFTDDYRATCTQWPLEK